MAENISLGHAKYQSFIILYNDNICGYCYLSQFREKEAYDHTAEVTLYIEKEFTGNKIGAYALNFIENIARQNGIKNLIGVITLENVASISLFDKCGYKKCGLLNNIGKKFGRTLDVVWYQKELI